MSKRVFVAGHKGLVGSAVFRELSANSDFELIVKTHAELDLENYDDTMSFFADCKPDYVVMSAAKVGGIVANSSLPVDFLQKNLKIQLNVFEAAYASGIERMLFLGSSCIYPKECPQPIKEDYLLTGPLEFTNRAYALAKIAGVEACWAFNRQHGTKYLALMPTNMYGPGDNYHPEYSHVLPAMLRRFHEAKLSGAPTVSIWGSGTPRREFMYSEDLGRAVKFFLQMPDKQFSEVTRPDEVPLLNVGTGQDLSINELAHLIKDVVGFQGDIVFDATKPDGTMRKLLDVSKINSLGWQAKVDLLSGVELSYQDFLKNHFGN